MLEIRFQGRGGQGAVIASELLAQAAFLDGRVPQSFPFFGVERRGAAVTAFARIDQRPIRVRTSVTTPDVVVVLDPGLIGSTRVTEGLKPNGLLLVNTANPIEALCAPSQIRLATVDATLIALDHRLGTRMLPIVNTAILGALAQVSGAVSLEALGRAIEQFVPARPDDNRRAAEDGYREVRWATVVSSSMPAPSRSAPPVEPFPEGPIASVPSETIHTSAWRTFTPMIRLERCTKCNFCWKFCPDNAIQIDAAGFPVIRLDYCKGCGICATECSPKAITMVAGV